MPDQPLSAGWELASVLMEVVAFFFVTIDLYGEERLQRLQDKLSSWLYGLLARIWRSYAGLGGTRFWGPGTVWGFVLHCVLLVLSYSWAVMSARAVERNPGGWTLQAFLLQRRPSPYAYSSL